MTSMSKKVIHVTKEISGSHKKRTFDSKNNLRTTVKAYSLRMWLLLCYGARDTHTFLLSKNNSKLEEKRCKIHPGSTEIMIHIWNTKISMAITHLYHMAFSSQIGKCFLQNKIQTQDCNTVWPRNWLTNQLMNVYL